MRWLTKNDDLARGFSPTGIAAPQVGTDSVHLLSLRRDAPCDEDCNRAAARLQRRGPILSAVTTDRRKTMTTMTSMKRFGCA
jgi:hypothetical protein